MSQIIFVNDGELIKHTNYFETPYFTEKNVCYLSQNDGALRLLVPHSFIDEIKTGKDNYIVASQFLEKSYDIVFDDYSDNPFAITIMEEMIDRPLEKGRYIHLHVYSEYGLQHSTAIDINL